MVIISIVTYNNADIIKKTINTIIQYTQDVDYKIVVYDNGSLDSTIEMIRSIENKHVCVVESGKNTGFGYGHNYVWKNYEADYYLIYNPDVFLHSNIIEKLIRYMDNHMDVGMVTPKVCYPTGEIQYLCKRLPTVFDLFMRRFLPKKIQENFQNRRDRYEMRETGYDKEFIVPYATGCFMFFRAAILKKIGGFDEKIFMYLEDTDITRRTNQVSKVMFYPYEYVTHLWGKGAHKNWKLTWINIQSAFYYFSKWGWKFY